MKAGKKEKKNHLPMKMIGTRIRKENEDDDVQGKNGEKIRIR